METLPTEVLAAGRFLRLLKRGRWEYADRVNARGAAVIVAVTDERRLILIEQLRVPLDRRVIELPAGLVGDEQDAHEQFAAAANRELLEETGYEAEQMIEVAHGPPSAGLATELVTFFVAQGLRRVHAGGGTEHENIVVHEVALAEADAWLKRKMADGLLVDPKVYAGLFFAADSPAKLRRLSNRQFGLAGMLLIFLIVGPILGMGVKWYLTRPRPSWTQPVHGMVTLPDGSPLPGGSVTFSGTGKGYGASGAIAPNGSFQLSTFDENDGAPEGDYSVSIVSDDGRPLVSFSFVTIKPGQNTFTFQVPKP